MPTLHRSFLSLFLLMCMVAALWSSPVLADFHHPTTPPLLKVDNIDIYWKRADQKYIRFTVRIFNASVENMPRPFDVRMSVRSNLQEDFRPIKIWHQEHGIGGHEMEELVYRPGAITDTAIYTGRFQIKIDIVLGDKVLDSQVQSYP